MSAGRPPFAPTDRDREQVKTMCGMGIPEVDIATMIGITAPTLRKHFRQEIRVGHITATTAVAQSLYRQATNKEKPNVAAAIFWMKCRAGWKEDPAAAADSEIGKKAYRTEKARGVARGKFSPALAPKLVVNNG